MSAEHCRRVVNALRPSTEALAALGAGLASVGQSRQLPAETADNIQAVIDLLQPELLNELQPHEAESIRASLLSFFRQALDLLEDPFGENSWASQDPQTLQAQGRGSVIYTSMFAEFAETHSGFQEKLNKGGTFLDVGCGTGHIALSMARRWPSLRVHGIDILEAALSLADSNCKAEQLTDRVKFENLDFGDLRETNRYCGAFIAGAFIPEEPATAGIRALYEALEPGGWVFYGLYRSPTDPLARAVTALRLARSGGHLWATVDIEHLLLDTGFGNLVTVENESVAMFVAGQKPSQNS